ncbi:MAG: heat shock protein HtpX, partial [Gammaproteobacteria bacterium]
MLRILLFTATNFAIMIVISVVWSLLGLDKMLLNSGISVGIVQVLPFALAFGMGGSIVSLLISKWMAIRSTGAQLITDPSNKVERWLVDTVAKQAEAAGIGMPDVAVFQSAQPNAFATGASRNNALVAVSTGLLHNMSQNEVEAVLAHEVS